MKFGLLSISEISDPDWNRAFLTKTVVIKLNVNQNMEHIQAKQDFSILIMKKKSAITKLSDAISGQHFIGLLLLNEEKPSRSWGGRGENKFEM